MRNLAAVFLIGLLAACSSGGGNRILNAALDQLFSSEEEASSGGQSAPLTRAAVEASGVAMIRARLVNDAARATLVAASDNGGYVTYLNRSQQSLTLRGSLITASRGLGYDLLSVEAATGDPLVTPRSLADWPERVTRVYVFPGLGPEGRKVRVSCSHEVLEPREIEIVEVTHQGMQVRETCSGDAEFQNLFFVGNATGRVWRALQWLGPDQGLIDLEIVEPYTPD